MGATKTQMAILMGAALMLTVVCLGVFQRHLVLSFWKCAPEDELCVEQEYVPGNLRNTTALRSAIDVPLFHPGDGDDHATHGHEGHSHALPGHRESSAGVDATSVKADAGHAAIDGGEGSVANRPAEHDHKDATRPDHIAPTVDEVKMACSHLAPRHEMKLPMQFDRRNPMFRASIENALNDKRETDNFVATLKNKLSMLKGRGASKGDVDAFEKRVNKEYRSNRTNHLCVLVPFRDRHEQLHTFVPHMTRFLNAANISHEIWAINQVDSFRFNRAQLLNAGIALGGGRCNYFAMHDVDLLPLNPALDYSYPVRAVRHVSGPQYHPKYHYPAFVGGILVLNAGQFLRINGLSNNFWGWGKEDDELFARLRDADLEIERPTGLNTDSNNTFQHLHDDERVARDKSRDARQKWFSRQRDMQSGLRTLTFTLTGLRIGYVIDEVSLGHSHSKDSNNDLSRANNSTAVDNNGSNASGIRRDDPPGNNSDAAAPPSAPPSSVSSSSTTVPSRPDTSRAATAVRQGGCYQIADVILECNKRVTPWCEPAS